jgi:hypothetical protein
MSAMRAHPALQDRTFMLGIEPLRVSSPSLFDPLRNTASQARCRGTSASVRCPGKD